MGLGSLRIGNVGDRKEWLQAMAQWVKIRETYKNDIHKLMG